MTTPTFDQFRRKLADAVTIAINSGVKVSADDPSCHCPMGCLPNVPVHRPGSIMGARAAGASQPEAWAFMRAFDMGDKTRKHPEYVALGLAYRLRFP